MTNKRIELTEFQKQALTGSMLGDGHLVRIIGNKINSALSIGRSTDDKVYLEYEASIFANFTRKAFKVNSVKDTAYFIKSKGKIQYLSGFQTTANPIFTEWRNVWYPKQIKIIPQDLELSSVAVAHWIADDGNIGLSGTRNPRFTTRLYTDCFTLLEVEFLRDLLQKRYNQRFNIVKHNNDHQHIISCYDDASRAMFLDIDTHFKMTRKRLWDDPKTCFYSNQPPPQRNLREDFAERKIKMAEIIKNNDKILIQDILKIMNYKGDGVEKISRLLVPYKNIIEISDLVPGVGKYLLIKH